jgi:hypothetical protein
MFGLFTGLKESDVGADERLAVALFPATGMLCVATQQAEQAAASVYLGFQAADLLTAPQLNTPPHSFPF